MLEKLDIFLKRIEPEIESITGEERDTASFMKMMRLFNEVCATSMLSLYFLKMHSMSHEGPRSAVGNISGNRCESDCRSRGRKLYPGPVPYFRGD